MRGGDGVEFHQIQLGVRPTRAAVVIGADAGWENSALRVMEFLSVTWGGRGDIIVTCDEGTTDDQIWSAVECYDADVWARHVSTFRGLQIGDPEGYEAWLEEETDRLHGRNGGDRDQLRRRIERTQAKEATTRWAPPNVFWERTRFHLAPNWPRDRPGAATVLDDTLPTGLLVDVTHLSPLPSRLLVPNTDHLPIAARLLIASKYGALSPVARVRLKQLGVPVHDVVIPEDDLKAVVSACWGASLWPLSDDLRYAMAVPLQLGAPEQMTVGMDAVTHNGPFAMSMVGLSTFVRPTPIHKDWPLIVVIGDTADDFALAVAADRLMGPAMWVPPAILGADTIEVLGVSLASLKPADLDDRTVHVTSCSLGHDALAAMTAELVGYLDDGADRAQVSRPVPFPRTRPWTTLDTRLASTIADELFLADTTGRGIRAQLPSGVTSNGPSNLSWWMDVIRLDHQLPPRWPLNKHLVARSGGWTSQARVTRDGLAFHSHPLGFISGGLRLDQVVDNPRLRFLDAKAIFDALAADADVKLVESPAGRFTTQTSELWGSLPALIDDLKRPLVRNVLDAFQSTTRSGTTPGNCIEDRRYLALPDLQTVAKKTGDEPQLHEFVDWSLHHGVLRRGLSLSCPYCNQFGWYDADDIGQTSDANGAAPRQSSTHESSEATATNRAGTTNWQKSSTRHAGTTSPFPFSPWTKSPTTPVRSSE